MTEREKGAEDRQDSGSEWRDYYAFEAVAARMGIPRNMWEQPKVQQFVEVNRQVNILQATVAQRTEQQSGKSSGPNGTPSLQERYYAVSKLARVAEIVLKDGLDYDPIAMSESDRKYVGELLTFALKRLDYGLQVVDATIEPTPDSNATDNEYSTSPAVSEPLSQPPHLIESDI
jgi:hypothetical protein